jgi:hypothetical protein
MAKITMEIESRALYVSNDERDVAELFELTGMCEYEDDAETTNDFDVVVRSDTDRYTNSVACDTEEQSQSDQRDAAITGSRTSATEFTRTAGTWTASSSTAPKVMGLMGYRAWIYNSATPDAGVWYNVLSNTTTKIVIESGSIASGCNRVQLQARTQIRHHIQLTPRCDFYGSFFQYKVTKKIASFDGKFKWFGVKGSAIPRNVDPEFRAGLGAISNGW